MKALILTSSPERSQALAEGFKLSGFEVRMEQGAVSALTQLERTRPDVIVCADPFDEMSGPEFHETLRADRELQMVCLVMLGQHPPQGLSPFDRVLPPQTQAAEVVREAYKLILDVTRKTHEMQVPGTASRKAISGSLRDVSLFELAQWLSRSAKTGRLTVRIAEGRADWFFSGGQLIHAEFAGKSGEDAVLHLVLESEHCDEGQFDFEPMDKGGFFLEPVTIRKNTDQLLLSLAVEMDHMQQGRTTH